MSFNLPNFLNSTNFNDLRFEMKASLSESREADVIYSPIDLPIVQRLREDGVDVKFDEIKVLDDGTLAFKGYRVLLYIRDVASYGEHHSMPRFHLAYCRTLETMQANSRFQRYVVANRDDGIFSVNIIQEPIRTETMALNVCQNCLSKLRWKGFRYNLATAERTSAVRKFALKEFFSKYPRDLHSVKPDHTSESAPINDYTSDWETVSERTKNTKGFRCENQRCHINLTQRESRYLHVHHENGLKYDNAESNLKVLCIRCHANEPMHGHMKNLPDYIAFAAKYC